MLLTALLVVCSAAAAKNTLDGTGLSHVTGLGTAHEPGSVMSPLPGSMFKWLSVGGRGIGSDEPRTVPSLPRHPSMPLPMPSETAFK